MRNRRIVTDPYIYTAEVASIANSASANDSFTIEADADFELHKLTYIAAIADLTQTESSRVVPLVTVIITSTGSGRQLMDAAVPIPSMFGTGEIPFILPQPKIFKARSAIQVTFQNYSNATTYTNVKLAFIGVKRFQLSN